MPPRGPPTEAEGEMAKTESVLKRAAEQACTRWPFPTPRVRGLGVAALGALLLGACGDKPGAPTGRGPSGPVEVGVVQLAAAPVALAKELPGRTSAYRVAEVRARVNGIVLKRLFTEGSDVEGGAGALRDRSPALPGGARQRQGHARAGRGEPGADTASRRSATRSCWRSGPSASRSTRTSPRRTRYPSRTSPRRRPPSRRRKSTSATPTSLRPCRAASAARR